MRLFALKDANDPRQSILAVLACYESGRHFFLDMPDGTDPWTVPLILSSFAQRGQVRIGPDWSKRWVESRLVPKSRQNLGEILRENGLEDYDTLRLLEMTSGRNSQDDCYLEPLQPNEAPAWFAEREAGRIEEVVALEGCRLLVAFRTGEVRICDAHDLAQADDSLTRVVADDDAFVRAEVAPGGRGIQWGSSVFIGDDMLHAIGKPIPLSWADLKQIVPALLVDTAQAEQMLGCTRQNINALMKRRALSAAKTSGKATMFFLSDIRARRDGYAIEAPGVISYFTVRI